jgi:hypothetical protein
LRLSTDNVAPVRRALLTVLTALGLSVLAPSVSTAAAAEVHPEWGATSGHDAKIRNGCHRYHYDYALTPPDGDWMLETFLVGPRGKAYGSDYFITGEDPLAGPGTLRLCRQSTKGGRYTIRAKLSVINGGDYYEGWLPDSTFRLRKPRR